MMIDLVFYLLGSACTFYIGWRLGEIRAFRCGHKQGWLDGRSNSRNSTAQARSRKLENLLVEQHKIIDEMNTRGKTFNDEIVMRLKRVWDKQRELLSRGASNG